MSKRLRKKSGVKKDAWLNTYADMVTLILVFFVLLYSMSTIDKEKYSVVVSAFSANTETVEQSRPERIDKDLRNGQIQNMDDLYEYLKKYIKENKLEESVQVEKGKGLVFIRFTSTLFFEPDEAILKNGGVEILSSVGEALSQVEPMVKTIRIDGHTAEASPGTSSVDDRALSTDRANAVLKYLETDYIKEPSKLLAVGYGMYRPIAPNDTEENRAKNRRVEILVTKEDGVQDEIDKIYNSVNSSDI